MRDICSARKSFFSINQRLNMWSSGLTLKLTGLTWKFVITMEEFANFIHRFKFLLNNEAIGEKVKVMEIHIKPL